MVTRIAKKAIKKSPAKRENPRLAGTGQRAESHFPIVGIGASAGGLEAFTQLLKNLSPTTGMAFVLVQHLAPKQESLLPELLARVTSMPVSMAQDGAFLEPDHVYVITPNTDLELAGGKLRVNTRSGAREPHHPVDHFFESLAAERGSTAIGVVLSGTASDGTMGVKAIKAEDGITFAQSEASAKYSGMPSSAIAAGFVDYVLPPEGIARELGRIAKHPYLRVADASAAPKIEGEEQLGRLFFHLRSATGVDFTHYKRTTIQRRIARRMVVRKMEKLSEYIAYAREHPAELRALYQDILISVTAFFRDPAMYRSLEKSILPRLLRKRANNDPLRVWVPGCSTGEEAYSIAITTSEYLRAKGSGVAVQVFATDVNELAIEKARTGIYPENIAADVPPDLLQRYFAVVTGGYQVRRALRDLCVFARQNVIRDAPFSRLDLISCRNVLIYLAPVLQRRAMTVFHYALKPSGFLVLGTSETIGPLDEYFTLIDRKNKIYSKKPTPAKLAVDFETSALPVDPEGIGRRPAESPNPIGEAMREADRLALNRYAPAGVLVDENLKVVQFRGRIGTFLGPEQGEANLSLFRMARGEILPELRTGVYRARQEGKPVRIEDAAMRHDGSHVNIAIDVIPLTKPAAKQPYLLITFQPRPGTPEAAVNARGARPGPQEVRVLRQELVATKQYLQSIIEQQEANNEELKSANEEIQSSNEELQSTNEEMETAKEELQSTNEELTTVNEELQNRNLELAQVNNDLTNLLSSVRIPLVMVDNNLRLRRYTPSAKKLLNLIPTDVGRPLLDIKPNIDVPDLETLLTEVIENLHVVEREVHDSSGRTYALTARPYRTADKLIDGAVLVLVDISAMKSSLAQTQELREYAEAVAATVRDPLVALDGNLCVLTANAQFYNVFKLNPAETKHKPFFELAHAAWDIPKLHAACNSLANGGFTSDLEVEAGFGDAGVKTMSINLRRVPSVGPARMFLLAIEDLSAQRLTENSLRDAQIPSSRLSRDAPVGILQLDLNGNAAFVNAQACAVTGVGEAEAAGIGWMKHLYPDDLLLLRAKIAAARLKGQGFTIEARFVMPAGKMEWTLLVAIPLMNMKGELTGFLGALTDETIRKDLEDQLRHAQKMEAVGRLAGGVAHDFNNMLTAIGSYASQLLGAVPEQNPARTLAVQIGRVVDQAALTTRQLLAFSRKQILRPRTVRLNDVLEEMRDLLVRLLGDRVEVVLAPAPDAGTVVVDPGQLQQIILNLAINSRDAMPHGGKVTLGTSNIIMDRKSAQHEGVVPGNYVCLTVSDNGIGMSAETRDRLFEPFFTTKPPGVGTGLGLSMVYGIVQQSGGSIHVDSEPGKGTTFRICLPRVADVPEKVAAPEAEPDATGSETILLVEDSAVVRSLVRELLEQRGYTVLEARDGREAAAIAAQRGKDVDLLLTDVMMPGMGGHELAKQMRRRKKNLKVVYMSGYSGEGLQAVEKGSNFLEKPFKPETLAASVRKVLDEKV